MNRTTLILIALLFATMTYAETATPVNPQITDAVTQTQITDAVTQTQHSELELRVAALEASLDELTRRKNIDALRVLFDYDEYTPNIGSAGLIDVVISFMRDYPHYGLTIEGHTDEIGMREYNLGLGERRAQAVRNIMIEAGIDPYRIKTISYGKERPEFIGSNAANWQRNRRVVFVLY